MKTQYKVPINPTTTIILRGQPADLHALISSTTTTTTTVWLRPKTHVEGYLEAAAKVIVYLVAACSGNATQAGNLVMLVLVLASAGLLALSNAQVRDGLLLRGSGRVVVSPRRRGDGDDRLTGGRGGGWRCGGGMSCRSYVPPGGGDNVVTDTDSLRGCAPPRRVVAAGDAWPLGGNVSGSLEDGTEADSAEKGEAGDVFGRSYVDEDEDPVRYRVQLDTRLGTLEVVARRERDRDRSRRDRGRYVPERF